MIDELPQRNVAVDHRTRWRIERLGPLHGKRRLARAGAEVERALRRCATECLAQLVHDVVLPHGTLSVVEPVADVWAREERTAGRDIEIEKPLEAERLHFGALFGAESFVGALRTHRVEPSAAPGRLAALERPVRILLHDILAVPRIGNHVAVAERGMARDLVAIALRMAHALLQLLLAAKRRLH